MSIAEIFEERAAFSFEVFPPKTDVGMEKLCGEGGVLEKLYTLNPDYISCTYGAGGTNVGKNLEVLDKIQKDGKCTPVTHFTCVGNTKNGIVSSCRTTWTTALTTCWPSGATCPSAGPAPAATCTTPPSW